LKAQLVSFQAGERAATGTPLSSSAYDADKVESYFDQAFVKEDEIGAGDFGRVFRVRSKVDQNVYAVKIARERYRGPTDRARKLEEVRKHQFLPPHSTIVKFHRSWEEQGRLYQQFELCNGTLQELADSQDDIPQSTVWSYLVDLLQALQHLHEHNHIHMDIKPENIFIGRDGICKVGDFGLMLDLSAADARKQAMEGDSRYLAPETLQGRFTKACDVFSLGITMLELACDLDLPRHGDLWQKIRMEGPDPASTMHLQPELRRVLLMMMTSEEDRRPSVMQLLDLPSVKSAVRRRGRQIFRARCKQVVVDKASMLVGLLRLFLSFLLFLINPIFDMFSPKPTPSTPPPSAVAVFHAQATSDAFSDEEPDMTTMSHESDLAVPLRDSDLGIQDSDSLDPDSSRTRSYSPPARTPHRSKCLARTPGANTPGKRLIFTDMDLEDESPRPEQSRENNVVAIKSSDTDDSDAEFTVKPQCLAARLAFDAFSDDEF